jgi:membrane protein
LVARAASFDTHGRTADRPSDIPKAGWFRIGKRVWGDLGRNNVSMIAAGVAYNELFAMFPAMAALVSIYGLFADPADVERQVGQMSGILPEQAVSLIGEQLHTVAGSSQGALGLSLAVSVLLALWGATRGVKALMTSLNIVYGEEEKRGFLRLNLVALGLTLAAVVFGVLALVFVAVVPAFLKLITLPAIFADLLSLARWPILALAVLLGLAVLYRFAPSRSQPRWRWVTWGAAVATLLWIVGSLLFSFYVANFGSYNETYGSVGAVIVLLLWFYLTAFIVLLGGQINAELELQTERDTTTGRPEPMGRRGARVADNVAKD